MMIPPTMKKYLMFLSYVGHEFRGVQKQLPSLVHGQWIGVTTVQETLEDALKISLKLHHDAHVFPSSRTDTGVHAIRSSVHVRLQREKDIDPDVITIALNKYFTKEDIGIRIQKTHAVADQFSVRAHATSRTYLYRLAYRKTPWIPTGHIFSNYLMEIPLSEYKRSYIIQDCEIDVDKMREAATLFPGTKDYFCFMGRPSLKPENISTIRTMYSLTINPGRPLMSVDPDTELFNFLDIVVCGRSFLYRQVRKTVGVLLAVGRGLMTIDDVRLLFDKPESSSWNPRATSVPPYGLYLLNVKYMDRDLCESQMRFDEDSSAITGATFAHLG